MRLTMEERFLLEIIKEKGSRIDVPKVCIEHKALLNLQKKGLIYTIDEIRPYHIIHWRLTKKGEDKVKSMED